MTDRADTPTISPLARVLGYAGLVPQVGAIGLIMAGTEGRLGEYAALAYACAILSFIGGIWWGFAVHGRGPRDGLLVLAVMPSLTAAFLLCATASLNLDWVLVAAGCAILLTLLADRWLAHEKVAPPGWMHLRVPLSIGLGALTIIAGAI